MIYFGEQKVFAGLLQISNYSLKRALCHEIVVWLTKQKTCDTFYTTYFRFEVQSTYYVHRVIGYKPGR